MFEFRLRYCLVDLKKFDVIKILLNGAGWLLDIWYSLYREIRLSRSCKQVCEAECLKGWKLWIRKEILRFKKLKHGCWTDWLWNSSPILELGGNWIWNTSSQADSARLFSLFTSLSTVVRHDVEKSLRQTRGTACFATRSALGFVCNAAYAQALNLRLWEWRVVRATKDSIVRLAWSASRESDCKHSTSSFRETKYFFIPSILVDKLVVVHLLNSGDSFALYFSLFLPPPPRWKNSLQIVHDRLIEGCCFIFPKNR